ncbi:uroplakin-3b-like [Rhinoderma darwinii]|uniref:uroplakin-3b-like n=1 Tax=Rhinoderma darwinii TaxID=43563 RepID=UPI003F672638
MDLYVKLGMLLIMAIAVDATEISEYIPRISKNMKNNITDKTFVLVQPDCIFTDFTSYNVWLVIALNNCFSTIEDSDLFPPVPYSTYNNRSLAYYHTLPLSAGQYPCSASKSSFINVIQIGSESCTENLFCNGELNNNLTYKVKFILVNSTTIIDSTHWLSNISLPKATTFQESSVWPSGRSGGMIALTSILSILLAILLVFFIAALLLGSQDICWKRTMHNEKSLAKIDFLSHSSYKSKYDHMYSVS